MTFKDDLRKILEDYSNYCYVGIEDTSQALSAITKLVEGLKRGAYKSGYHDALNNRPFKVTKN